MKTIAAHLKHIVGTYARAAVLGTAVLTTAFLAPTAAQARVFFSVRVAPPVIPVYTQPLCPGDGYIWTPGYWAYGDDGYYWVDGAWVLAPYEGALWTPGYWGYNDGLYVWNAGYWGPEVGYYGGIDYGFGYFGTGFYGGRWDRGHFFYNTAYNRIDRDRFHNVYDDRSHGSAIFAHPGSRGFDPHPRMDEHREASFRGNNGFNLDNRGGINNNQGNRPAFTQDNRGNDNRGNETRGGFNQQPNRQGFQGGDNQQHNFAAPQTPPAQNTYRQPYNGTNQARSFGAPQQAYTQPHNFVQQAPAQPHFSQPVQQARPAPVYSAPRQQQSFHGGGEFHGGGGGGGFHGGGGRR
jgi:uncharacterized membrane protein YgcG